MNPFPQRGSRQRYDLFGCEPTDAGLTRNPIGRGDGADENRGAEGVGQAATGSLARVTLAATQASNAHAMRVTELFVGKSVNDPVHGIELVGD